MCYYSLYFHSLVQGEKKGSIFMDTYGLLFVFGFLVGVFLGGGKEMFCQFVWILGFKVQTN